MKTLLIAAAAALTLGCAPDGGDEPTQPTPTEPSPTDGTDAPEASDPADGTASDATDPPATTDPPEVVPPDPADPTQPATFDTSTPVPPVELEPPAKGFQLRSLGDWIAPGTDVEYCEVVELPGTEEDVYYVTGFELKMHPWTHHVIVKAVEIGSATDANVKVGDKKPCVQAGSAFGEDLLDVTGAQQKYQSTSFPEGVGRVFYGGQKIIFDYHYFNPTTEFIPARHAVNFHTAAADDIESIAANFGFYNFGIFTLPGQQSASAGKCTFSHDVVLWGLTRHTHQWGTGFHVWHEGGEKHGEHLWTSTDWEHDTDFPMPDGPTLFKAGTGFRFQCHFDNTTDHVLTFGVKATNEMCILFGTYWAPGGSPAVPEQDCQVQKADVQEMP